MSKPRIIGAPRPVQPVKQRPACWRAEGDLAEYKESIVPALMDKIRELEKCNLELVGRLDDAQCELKRTRAFIHEHGMEFALMSRLGEEGDPWGTQR